MAKFRNQMIAMMLVVVSAFVFTMSFKRFVPKPVSAATQEQFLSDVALIYKDTLEEAQAAIAGTDWKLYNKDLNKNAEPAFQDGVFLIYKTSTNVEDAITDLRVMDMYGGFVTSNYQSQLADSRAKYLEIVQSLRVVADEFAKAYEAEDAMAKLAYRQMQLYKDVQTQGGTETNMKMGDFFLNMPTDEKVVQVLFEGNTVAVSNLISLLAIGVSGSSEASLASRVVETYEVKDTLSATEYHETASALSKELETVRAKLLRYDTLKEEYDLTDEEMTEEEFQFMTQVGALAILMEQIPYGDTNFADFIRLNTWTSQDLYPFVAALTAGQKELVEMGQLGLIIQYGAPSKPMEDLYDAVEVIETELKDASGEVQPIDVYAGVDRSIFKGVFAMTNAAERQQALTGQPWDSNAIHSAAKPFFITSLVMAGASTIMAGVSIGLAIKMHTLEVAAATAKTLWEEGSILSSHTNAEWTRQVADAFAKKWGGTMKAFGGAAFALVLIALGVSIFAKIYNYYNPDYLEIPNTMIDVRETDTGDKYVKYTAAKVFGGKKGQENADLNAYVGKEWNALYYTKDANAGNSLTPNFVYRENNNTVSKRHQGVSLFGESNAYNLNSNVYNASAPGLYLTVRYSNTKKAAADMPTVVGSIMGGVGYAIAGIAGISIGAGGMLLFTHFRKKKKEEEVQ